MDHSESMAITSLSCIFEAVDFERILTKRVIHEYQNLLDYLKTKNLDGGEDKKNLETRIRIILKNRIRILSLIFAIMLFLSRNKLNLTGNKEATAYIPNFIDELTDINTLIADKVTAKFFEPMEKGIILSMVRTFLFFYEKTVKSTAGESRPIRYDREKIMNIVTTLELFLDPVDPFLASYDPIFAGGYKVAQLLVEKMLENENIGEEERFRLSEYLLKKMKIISSAYELRLIFQRSNYFLREGQFIKSLEEINRFKEVNTTLEETLSDYAGPKIVFLEKIQYREMVADTKENLEKLKLLELSYSLHEGMTMQEEIADDLSKLIQHMKSLQGKQVSHPFSPSAFLTSIVPILVQPSGIDDKLKIKVLESMFGSFVGLSINHIVNIGKELLRTYRNNEFALSPQDTIMYRVKIKEIEVFLHTLFSVPSFIERKELSVAIAELTQALVSILLHLTDEQPNFTLTSDFYDLLSKMYVYSNLSAKLDQFLERKEKFIGTGQEIMDYASELMNVAIEIKDFIQTVSANIELSLHWNILEYLYITVGVRQLNLAISADEEQAITLGEGNELMKQYGQIEAVVDCFLEEDYLLLISKKFRRTFETTWIKHRYYINIQRNLYVMLFNLFKGFSLTQRSGVGHVLIAKVSRMIEDLKVPAAIMSEEKFEPLKVMLTKVSELCNLILADGHNYQIAGALRELIKEYTKGVINPIA